MVKEVAVVCRLSFVAKSFVVCREVVCRLSRSRSSSFVAVCREVVRRRSLLFRRSSSSFVVVCRSLSSFAIVVRRYAVCRRLSSFVVCRRRRLSSFVVCRRCLRRLLSLIVDVVVVLCRRSLKRAVRWQEARQLGALREQMRASALFSCRESFQFGCCRC